MSREEIEYIPKSYKTNLATRWEMFAKIEVDYKEAWDQVITDKYKRSEAVLKHKI